MPVKPKVAPKPKVEKKKYVCLCCENEKSEDDFFSSKWSKFWSATDKKVLFCKTCLNKEFEENSIKFQSQAAALKIACHRLDVPYYESLRQTLIVNNTNFGIGMYLRILNNNQYQMKTFLNSLVDGELSKSEQEVMQEREAKWSSKDLKSKDRILKILKYDPYEDYDEFSRRLMFNLTSDYLVDEDTINDPHKLQSVIEMVKLYQQADILNKQVLSEFNTGSMNENRIKTLSAVKNDCLTAINNFAKNNGFAANLSSKGNKGSSSLAYFVKVLEELKFTETKVNLFDLKTCESFRQFADISNSSILQQIKLNQDDIGDMLSIQHTKIKEYRQSVEMLEEENRLLKILLEENNIIYEDERQEDILDIDNFNLEGEENGIYTQAV